MSEQDNEDICGLCGTPGADKIPNQEHWPAERVPDRPFVHAECERAECEMASLLYPLGFL
jgi:hypothetical protein